MTREVKALSFEQSRDLLPDEFRPFVQLAGRKKLLQTPLGVMAFRQSSLLDCGEWKTSYNEDDISTEIDYLLYALGYDGVLVLSRQVMLGFKDRNLTARWAKNGYPIHIFKDNGRYFWHGIGDNTLDVTEYFIPSNAAPSMSITEALSLLGSPYSELTVNNQIASARNFSVCYRFADDKGANVWQTSEAPERIKETNELIIGLGGLGLLVVPSFVILEYWNKYGVKPSANGEFAISIKNDNGAVVLYNKANSDNVNVSKYLV